MRIFLIILLCTACTPNTKMNIAKAKFLCKDYGGLYKFESFNANPVICIDGTKFSISRLDKTIITDSNYYPRN